MFLAALADSGLELAPLEAALQRAGLEVKVRAERAMLRGLIGSRLVIEAPGVQPLRRLSDLTAIVERMGLEQGPARRTVDALSRLAEVEAAVHGIGVEEVHFHEVGAVDTLVDVAGAFWALDELGVDKVLCSPLPWFSGEVDCAHGRLPLPAPATLELMRGKPVRPTGVEREILTPTGALLIDRVADGFGSGPEGRLIASGTGYGSFDPGLEPFGLRVIVYENISEMIS
jgi:hypothetical protein